MLVLAISLSVLFMCLVLAAEFESCHDRDRCRGETLSLLLTLLAAPIVYSLLDDLASWIRRRLPRARTVEESGEKEIENDASRPPNTEQTVQNSERSRVLNVSASRLNTMLNIATLFFGRR